MSWTAGTFSRFDGSTGCADDEGSSVGITSARMDLRFNDLATGVNAALAKDGSNKATGDLDLDSHKLTNLASGTARTHAATVAQLQDFSTNWGGTSGGTADAQTITLTPATALSGYCLVAFLAGYTNTGPMTLNPNSLGAKSVYKRTGLPLQANDIRAGQLVVLLYEGTRFRLVSAVDNLTGIVSRNAVAIAVSSTTSATAIYTDRIPANALGTNRTARYRFFGHSFNNTGSTDSILYQLYLDGVLIASAVPSITTSASNNAPISIDAVITAANSTAAQVSLCRIVASTTPVANGTPQAISAEQITQHSGLTRDSTADLDIVIKATPNTSSTNLIATGLSSTLEIV